MQRMVQRLCLRSPSRFRRPCLLIALVVGVALWSFLPSSPRAQPSGLQYRASLFAAGGSAESLPFWLTANRYGTVDPRSANVGTRLSLRRPFASDETVDYAAGLDLLGRVSDESTLHVHQIYGRLRYGKLQATAGRYEQLIGRVDTTLSLGGTTLSRNASPPPKISVSTAGYLNVPGTRGYLAVNGYLAHGWLEDSRFVQDAFLHEKYLYARLLPADFPVNGHAGIIHHALWGGTHPTAGPQPDTFRDFIDVLLGHRTRGESADTPSFTNHLAAYDFSLRLDLGGFRGSIYRQFYHEDIPSLDFRNPWDGLWGVSLRRKNATGLLTHVLWEHLVMTRHNAKYSEGEERGEDTYYNHSFYASGWTYHGRSLGIPLLFADGRRPGIVNNIVVAHHLGFEGGLTSTLTYRLFATYSRNYGAQKVCSDPACSTRVDERTPRRDQYSFLLELAGPLASRYGLHFNAAAALDLGALYPNRVGVMVGVSWSGTGL